MRARRPYILLSMLLLLLPLGCTRYNERGGEEGGEGIRLTVWCQDPETKAGADGVKPGEQELNENLISTLDVFYYPEGLTDDPAVLHERFTPERNNSATVITYTSDYFIHNVLVPSGNSSFWVYVIANYPGNESDFRTNSVLKSVDELKELAIEADFNENLVQASFVMDGLVQLPADRNRREVANGTVQLRRLAAKLSIHINVPEYILNPVTMLGTNDELVNVIERWEPMVADDGNGVSGMLVYLEQAVSNAKLGGSPLTVNPAPDYFTFDRRGFAKSTDALFPYVTSPFYTYPTHWEYASKTSPTKEPTLKLILPWKRIPDNTQGAIITATQRQFYYKIIIPDDMRESSEQGEEYLRSFVRNNWYKLNVSVGMLGSETNEDAIEVGDSYYVCHWQDKEVVVKHAEIGKARFLSVEKDNYVLNNESTLSIPFSSSHPTRIVNITASKPNHLDGQSIPYSDAAADWLSITTDASGAHVVFNHPLNNNISDANLDCSPYTVTFTLVHSDQAANLATATYKKTVTITQYPAIYIKSEKSNGIVYLNGTTYSGDNSSITVNDNYGNDIGSIVKPSGVDGSSSQDTNNNQYLYTLYVTVLPSGSSAVIGDPRTDGSSAVVTTLNGLNSTANYRPVAENTKNVIAPIVKIASSYGKTHALFYSNARTRCAAYQEYGYPAGRWRLPTVAEIQFFVSLSEKGVIPTLFNPGRSTSGNYTWYNYYWAGGYQAYHGVGDNVAATVHQNKEGSWSHGNATDSSYEESVTVGNTTYSHNLVYTRCVYDVWYWGDSKDTSHLTSWGGYQTTR